MLCNDIFLAGVGLERPIRSPSDFQGRLRDGMRLSTKSGLGLAESVEALDSGGVFLP